MNTISNVFKAADAALALGACSGDPPANITTPTQSGTGTEQLGGGTDDLTDAQKAFHKKMSDAANELVETLRAVNDAMAAARRAATAAMPAARDEARRLIGVAFAALDGAVEAADAAVAAAADGSMADIGAAARVLYRGRLMFAT